MLLDELIQKGVIIDTPENRSRFAETCEWYMVGVARHANAVGKGIISGQPKTSGSKAVPYQ
jgi:hypothetical protein